jgi:hypothetical protein
MWDPQDRRGGWTRRGQAHRRRPAGRDDTPTNRASDDGAERVDIGDGGKGDHAGDGGRGDHAGDGGKGDHAGDGGKGDHAGDGGKGDHAGDAEDADDADDEEQEGIEPGPWPSKRRRNPRRRTPRQRPGRLATYAYNSAPVVVPWLPVSCPFS